MKRSLEGEGVAMPLEEEGQAAGEELVLLARQRLLDAMAGAARRRLTVLAAPAGFGKTVLVRQWAARQAGLPMTSVTLRPGDDAPRVAARLFAAAARLGADVGVPHPGWIPAPGGGGLGPAFLGTLRDWLASVGEAILVLDAFDAPQDPSLAADLDEVVRRAPAGIHLVVTRRSAFPGRHLRLADGTVVIDAQDLAFTADETQRLVRKVSGRELADDEVDALVRRTAGWAVGIKVAATSLRGPAAAHQVIENLSSERQVTAFLRQEVLDRQPLRVRRFLVRTAVLDSLDSALCRVVTGEHAAGLMLHVLEHAGALVRRGDGEEESFAHHELLRDVLRQELHVTEPGIEGELQARAAEWHSRRGEPEHAVRYLAEAERWDALLDLLDHHAPTLFEQGDAARLAAWIEAIPAGGIYRRKRVGLRLAYAHALSGATHRAEQVLRDVERHRLLPGERVVVRALRAGWAFHDAPPAGTVDADADATLAALDAGGLGEIPNVLGMTSPAQLRTMAAGARALALWHAGDVAGARLGLAALVSRTDLYAPWKVRLVGALALLEAWEGNLRLAQRHGSRALTLAASTGLLEHPSATDARLALAHVCREHDDLAGADELLKAAQSVADGADRPAALAVHAVERALWYLAAGQAERGLAEVRAHEVEGSPAAVAPVVDARLRAAEARLLLAHGDLDHAGRVVEGAGGLTAPLAEAAVHLAVVRHDIEAARLVLKAWPLPDDDRPELERELWAAVVDLEDGRRTEGLARAAEVVTAARAEARVRLFLDAGRPAERLLRALARVAPTPWVHQLLEAAGSPVGDGPGLGLSQREQEVVRFLPTPLSCAEIAGQLYISLNTLKTHLRTIYRKLGVSGRPDAIRRAEELGIA
ncbi:MAG TPA: LuxR C-terminal-related transcriptional regulator [Acidimicrobiales bacterium]|nr:LuxR C-terminal-related transcriptional regulator [Acidimicrobiales bacterium]